MRVVKEDSTSSTTPCSSARDKRAVAYRLTHSGLIFSLTIFLFTILPLAIVLPKKFSFSIDAPGTQACLERSRDLVLKSAFQRPDLRLRARLNLLFCEISSTLLPPHR